ncbi:MAG: ferrichrome-iron receptor [Verrucomicrobia bacterium]|nr:ferrichrome-iron receptor [Verrucomicrobiota bacterium]
MKLIRRPVLPFALSLLMLAPLAQAQTAPEAQVTPEKTDESVVHMEAFKVSTNIGSYRESGSGMATKIPLDLKEIASSLQILNATAISDRSPVSLQDVFNYVVGATQSQGNINGFTFRGFSNTGTFTQNIEFDGLQGPTLKKGGMSASNVERLEFLKGPNSVLYGLMKPGGMMNIVSKNPQDVRQTSVRFTLATYAGEFTDFGSTFLKTVSIDTTGAIDAGKHLLYRLVVDAGSVPPSRPGDNDRYFSIYPAVTYRWSAETFVTVKFESSQDVRRQDEGLVPIFTNGTAYGPTARFITAPYNTVYNDPTDKARDTGSSGSLSFQTVLSDWTIRLQTRSVWHLDTAHVLTINNANTYFPTATFANPNTTLRRQYNNVANGHRYNFFDTNAYRAFGPDSFKNTILVGVGGGQEVFYNQRFAFGPNVSPAIALFNPVLGQSPYPADGTATQSARNYLTNLGVYLSDQIKLGDRANISLGIRRDQQVAHGIDAFNPTRSPYVAQVVSAVVGQAGLVYNVTKQLSAYGSWSQSFYPNSVTQIDSTGKAGFPPEKGQQYETGLKFDTPDKKVFLAASVYDISRTNVSVASGTSFPVTGQAIFRLDGEQRSKGLELEAQWQPYPYWQIQAGAAFSKAYVAASTRSPQSVGADLASAPRRSGSFWTRYNVPRGALKGIGFGLGVIYQGPCWNGDPSTTVYFQVPGWTRADVSVFYKWKRQDFSLNVQNALDRRYIANGPSAITLTPGEQRKITLSSTTRF